MSPLPSIVLCDDDAAPALLEVDETGALVVRVAGVARSVDDESFLVGLGALPPPWWLPAVGVHTVLAHNPGAPIAKLFHYLSRPRGDRQVLVRAAWESGAGPQWLWWAFAFDPHPSVRHTWMRRLPEEGFPAALSPVIHGLLRDPDPAVRARIVAKYAASYEEVQAVAEADTDRRVTQTLSYVLRGQVPAPFSDR